MKNLGNYIYSNTEPPLERVFVNPSWYDKTTNRKNIQTALAALNGFLVAKACLSLKDKSLSKLSVFSFLITATVAYLFWKRPQHVVQKMNDKAKFLINSSLKHDVGIWTQKYNLGNCADLVTTASKKQLAQAVYFQFHQSSSDLSQAIEAFSEFDFSDHMKDISEKCVLECMASIQSDANFNIPTLSNKNYFKYISKNDREHLYRTIANHQCLLYSRGEIVYDACMKNGPIFFKYVDSENITYFFKKLTQDFEGVLYDDQVMESYYSPWLENLKNCEGSIGSGIAFSFYEHLLNKNQPFNLLSYRKEIQFIRLSSDKEILPDIVKIRLMFGDLSTEEKELLENDKLLVQPQVNDEAIEGDLPDNLLHLYRTLKQDKPAHEVLGLKEGASTIDLNRAWKKNMLIAHPDKCKDHPNAGRWITNKLVDLKQQFMQYK